MTRLGSILIFAAILITIGAAIYVFKPFGGWNKSQDNIRKEDLRKIAVALEEYHRAYGKYPASSNDYKISPIDDNGRNTPLDWGAPWKPFISYIPKDPGFQRNYVYVSSNNDGYQSYRLYASMGNKEEASCSLGSECANVPSANACGKNAPCNYGITSGNVSP